MTLETLDRRVSASVAIASSLIGVSFLLYQVVKTESYGALVVAIAALIVGCLPRASVRHVLAASVAPAALAVALSRGAVLLKDPLATIHAQDPGQDVVIALMVAVFALTLDKRQITSGVGTLIFLSLPFHSVAVLAITAGVLATRARRDEEEGAMTSSLVGNATPAVLTALIGVASLFPSPPKTEIAPEDPRAAVEYWRTRENLFRARHVALAWAQKEKLPREGYLTLAIIDWDLGEKEKAQKVLTKVLTRTDDPSVLAEATSLATKWGLPTRDPE